MKRKIVKKISVYVAVFCILVSMLPVTVFANPESEAENTEEAIETVDDIKIDVPVDAILLSTPEEVLALAENCRINTWSVGKVVALTKDIDMSGVEFEGIPTFGGTFLGQGYTIKGLNLIQDGSHVGFFRYVQKGATIHALSVQGLIQPQGSKSVVGAVAGSNAGTIYKCNANVLLSGYEQIGGIAGVNEVSGLILDCTSTGIVYGNHFVGGIVGENHGVVRNCTNNAQVNAQSVQNSVSIEDITMDSMINTESASTTTDIGGIAGISSGVIRSCWNKGAIGYQSMGYNVGGIVGTQNGYVVGCANFADVEGRKEVGGIVGHMEPNIVVTFSEDTLQQLSEQMEGLDSSVDGIKNSIDRSSEDIGNQIDGLENDVENIQNAIDALQEATASDEYQDELDALMDFGTEESEDDAKSEETKEKEGSETEESKINEDIISPQAIVERNKTSNARAGLHVQGSNIGNTVSTSSTRPGTGLDFDFGDFDISDIFPNLGTGNNPETDSNTNSDSNTNTNGSTSDNATPNTGTESDSESDFDINLDDIIPNTGTESDSESDFDINLDDILPNIGTESDSESGFDINLDDILSNTGTESDNESDFNINLDDILPNTGTESDDESDFDINLEDIIPDLDTDLDNDWNSWEEELEKELEALEKSATIYEDRVTAATNDLSDALDSFYDESEKIKESTENYSKEVENEVDGLLTKLDAMKETVNNMDDGIKVEWSDVSAADTEEDTIGKIDNCINLGNVTGDMNVGGIAGVMAEENDLDEYEDTSIYGDTSLNVSSEVRVVVRNCRNYGTISAGKQYAGGIAGYMMLGAVLYSTNMGNLDSLNADYVGGIAGCSDAVIRGSSCKAVLAGDSYVGGIAGAGHEVQDCYAFVRVEAHTEKAGAIVGYTSDLPDGEEDTIINNYYYVAGRNVGGIDGIAYTGATNAMDMSGFLQLPYLSDAMKTVNVTFKVEEQEDVVLTVAVGESLGLDKLPVLSVEDGSEYNWKYIPPVTSRVLAMGETETVEYISEALLSNLLFNQTYEAVFDTKNTVISSTMRNEKNLSVLLAEGSFAKHTTLEMIDTLKEETNIAGDDLIVNWNVYISNPGVSKLHYLIPEGSNPKNYTLYVKNVSGTWVEREYTVDGTYMLFDFADGETAFAISQSTEENQIIIILGVVAVFIIGVSVGKMVSGKGKPKKQKNSKEVKQQNEE